MRVLYKYWNDDDDDSDDDNDDDDDKLTPNPQGQHNR